MELCNVQPHSSATWTKWDLHQKLNYIASLWYIIKFTPSYIDIRNVCISNFGMKTVLCIQTYYFCRCGGKGKDFHFNVQCSKQFFMELLTRNLLTFLPTAHKTGTLKVRVFTKQVSSLFNISNVNLLKPNH